MIYSGVARPWGDFINPIKANSIYYMAGVQNSRSQGLYAVRRVGIEKLILHFGDEAGRNLMMHSTS